MPVEIGRVEALFRYPVKSMSGEPLESADVGWHGIAGDRRLALRRIGSQAGFPWLTATKLPELILYSPLRQEPAANGELPSHVRTPDGDELPVFGEELAAEIGHRYGSPVEMMHLDRGIFDEAAVSIITTGTVGEIGRLASETPDVRRFRPNLLLRTHGPAPFQEDQWVGGRLRFGDGGASAVVSVTNWDVRCSMVNLDPDSARAAPEVLKTIVRARETKAGVYATVVRRGRIAAGQPVYFEPSRDDA